jgi:hypothetical protein
MAREHRKAGCRPLMDQPAEGRCLNEKPEVEGDYEFWFYQDPRGQVRCFRRLIGDPNPSRNHERVFVLDMPPAMQKKFCQYAGVENVCQLKWSAEYRIPKELVAQAA